MHSLTQHLSMSTSSLLFPHDFNTTYFLLFSNKEFKELAMSLSEWSKHVDAGPPSSSRARTLSVARFFPNSVAACCNLCLNEISAAIIEVIAPPSSPPVSWICTRGMSSCFTLVPKQYGRVGV